MIKYLFTVYNIQHTKQMANCDIRYIDCRGYYDLGSEAISIAASLVILYRSIINYRQLKEEKGQNDASQFQKSIRRKIQINLLTLIFLSVLIFEILCSIFLFTMYAYDLQQIIDHRFNFWYKLIEIVAINMMNVLILTVGYLYWNALRAFYLIKQIKIPCVYSKIVLYLFLMLYAYSFCSICTSFGLLLASQSQNSIELKSMAIINVIGTAGSIVFFLASRLQYYRQILKSVKMGKNVIRREKLINVLVVSISLVRILLYIFEALEEDLNINMRQYNQDCMDQSPLHATVLLFLSLVVNLMPPFIFTLIFTTFERQKQSQSQIMRNLSLTEELQSSVRS